MKNKIKNLTYLLLPIGGTVLAQSCSYLDVVPDKMRMIDNSFTNRNEAERCLNTCYSYTPGSDSLYNNVALMDAGELWNYYPFTPCNDSGPWKVMLGRQNINDPLYNMWYIYYCGICNCNILLGNVSDMSRVGDLTLSMQKKWPAETKFLRTYYHFCLFRIYGPIVVADGNLPILATPEEVRKRREPVNKVMQYAIDLLDECLEDLPRVVSGKDSELGRVTQITNLALEARLLVTATSPLFNGNKDYADYVDKDREHLFNSTEDPTEWDTVIAACEAAIEISQDPELGLKLCSYKSNLILLDKAKCQLSIRNSITEKRDTELIWELSSYSDVHLQSLCMTCVRAYPNNMWGGQEMLDPTMRITDLYYARNDVSVDEDKTWDYTNHFKVKMHTSGQPCGLASYYEATQMDFDREPRFYVNIDFNGYTWYQYNCPSDNERDAWAAKNRAGQAQRRLGTNNYTTTGYQIKKLVSTTYKVTQSSYTTKRFPWPGMYLTDLCLLYAGALSEEDDASNRELTINYLGRVKARAGLKGVKESWNTCSEYPNRYETQEGLHGIIQCERAIELVFKGSHFWDPRRWKTANKALDEKIHGWNFESETPAKHYLQGALYALRFIAPRDHFWLIHQNNPVISPRLVQNPG